MTLIAPQLDRQTTDRPVLRVLPAGTGAADARRSLRRWLAVQAAVPLQSLFGCRVRGAFGILMYHRVAPLTPGAARPTWNVPPDRFHAQMAGLVRQGFEPWPLRRALWWRAEGRPLPRRAFVVTFDDGYENIYYHAWPVLRELGIPATIFLPTAYLDSEEPFPSDDWAEAGSRRVPPESWRILRTEQCAEMLESGLIEIGSHTHTHADFRGRPDVLREELWQSLQILRTRFGLRHVPFAFPYGTRNTGFSGPELMGAVRSAEVSCALTTEAELVLPGHDPFGWGRFEAESWDTGRTLSAKLGGWFTAARQVWQYVRPAAPVAGAGAKGSLGRRRAGVSQSLQPRPPLDRNDYPTTAGGRLLRLWDGCE